MPLTLRPGGALAGCLILIATAPCITLAAADRPHPELPLPKSADGGGARFVDLNGDGNEDLVVSNAREYGIYLFVPKAKERVNLQWFEGWTQVLREGRAGDANSIPPIVREDGSDNGVSFQDGAMWVRNAETAALPGGARRIPFSELLKVPGPAPKSPGESLRALHVKPGFQARLVASEPLVQDPVFVDWDTRGRLWVVEMGDYPFAPGETTKDGQTGQGQVSDLQTGRIKILEDTNGDGVFDKATLFLDGLRHPTSLAPWKKGVFIASIPDILFAEDTDGDGKCDRKEAWFTGFTAGNPQHLVNGFAWGLDGWFYGANGDSGGDITCVKSGKKVALNANDFRFNPRTGDFEIEAGRSQYGKWRDDWGNWFGNNNSTIGWHYYLPMRYLEQHPRAVVKTLRAVLDEEKAIFPVSPPVRRFNQISATNALTSGCAPMPWNRENEDWLLVCEPANNLVHREVLDYTQYPITSHRHADDAGTEFIASEDNWFRPTLARVGPDGDLYVADMYRLVLEHPEWIPAEISKGLELRAGEDRGRLYAVHETALGDTQREATDFSTTKGLLAALQSPNRWRRDTAQRVLVESGDTSVVPELKRMASAGETPPSTRVQALWTAHLLEGGESTPQLIAALKALAPKTRGAALVAAGSDDVDPRELATWFPKKTDTKPVVAMPVITHSNPDRQKVVRQYAGAATLKGDPERGHTLYKTVCIACHKLKGEGFEIGPDLGTVAAKPVEQLIEAILDPNRAVELRYTTQTIATKDGKEHAGLVVEENVNNLTLRTGTGVELIPTRDIARRTNSNKSLMPDGLEALLKPQDVADVLSYIRAPAVK